MRDYVVVFGAGVRPDGSAGPALRHRVQGAIAWAARDPDAAIMPTGGVGDAGPAEAAVAARALIAGGVAPARIVPEPTARDTLESVRRCHRLLAARGDCRRVVVCTSDYHQPRCALLFRLLGYRVAVAGVPRDRLSRAGRARLVAKELIATPYDAALLLLGLRG